MPKKLLAVLPVMLIMTVAALGVVYALYSEFVTEGNDTDARYTIITPQGVVTSNDLFDKTVKYNTDISVTAQGRTVLYSLDPTQITEITVSETDHDVILLGEVLLRVEQIGGSDDYTFRMAKTSGTMTGTFYTAIATSEDNSTFSSWDNKAFDNSTGVSYSGIDADIEYIKLRLYVDTSFQADASAMAAMPLQNVSFMIKVTMEE